jgi:signal transduction histidine kinase
MRIGESVRGLARSVLHPQTTVRWRLTLLYGGLFLVSGAALLAVTYTLVAHASVAGGPFAEVIDRPPGANPPSFSGGPPNRSIRAGQTTVAKTIPPPIRHLLASTQGRSVIRSVGSAQRISDLHSLEIESVIALAIMALISGALGWVISGRVLRPLRTMTATTQEISEANLNRRLAMEGPPDELRELGDTIDGLLGRLEGAFDAQRRFVANASHELRTPLTTARVLLEMVISDPNATVETFRETCAQVLDEGEQQEQLIDALLTLAQGQRGIVEREAVDLATLVAELVRVREPEAAARELALVSALEPAPVSGDRRLIERLVANLLDNALRHNDPGGRVRVTTAARGDRATLVVANTGPLVPADQVERLLQPFQRLATDRVGYREGVGLGLSIVAAIADAHDAQLALEPGAEGGLEIEVRFPRGPAPDRPALAPVPAVRVAAGP